MILLSLILLNLIIPMLLNPIITSLLNLIMTMVLNLITTILLNLITTTPLNLIPMTLLNLIMLSRPCPTLITRLVKRLVSLEVFLFYQSYPDLAHHSQSWTCIAHLSSAKSILDTWHIHLLVLMTLFLYLLCQPCFRPCLRSPPLVYFIDLVPFLFPPCSISDVGQSEGLGQTNNHNQHNKGLRKGEWWCASMVPEGKSLMGRGMLLHQRDDADADRGHSWWLGVMEDNGGWCLELS